MKKRPTLVPFIACVTPEFHRGRFCICGAGPVEHRQRFAIFVECGGWRPLCNACAESSASELLAILKPYHKARASRTPVAPRRGDASVTIQELEIDPTIQIVQRTTYEENFK